MIAIRETVSEQPRDYYSDQRSLLALSSRSCLGDKIATFARFSSGVMDELNDYTCNSFKLRNDEQARSHTRSSGECHHLI